MEFAGKLHPLIVHLPIGFLVAAFVFELLYRFYPLRVNVFSVRLLIGLAALSAIVSVLSGLLLSSNATYSSDILSLHKWGGIGLALLASLFYFLRKNSQLQWLKWGGWILLLLLLTWTGHMGGSLTHGQNYLAEAAPSFIKAVLAKEEKSMTNKPVDSLLVFEEIVLPIAEQKCRSCHGTEKRKGGLDLSSALGWQKGGKSGELFLTGNADESLILRRIILSEQDKKHMPPKGQSQIFASEFALLEWWIDQGAYFDTKLAYVEKDDRIKLILESGTEREEASQLDDLPSVSETKLANLLQNGIHILPVALQSNQLEVNFARDSVISDQAIRELRSVRENIVRMEFSFSGISDKQLEEFGQFENLRYISLASTNISDAGILFLDGLEQLEYLNLHSTRVSDNCLETIMNLANLKKLYLWNTKVSSEALREFKLSRPDVQVN